MTTPPFCDITFQPKSFGRALTIMPPSRGIKAKPYKGLERIHILPWKNMDGEHTDRKLPVTGWFAMVELLKNSPVYPPLGGDSGTLCFIPFGRRRWRKNAGQMTMALHQWKNMLSRNSKKHPHPSCVRPSYHPS